MKVAVLGRDGQVARSLARAAPAFANIDLQFLARQGADLAIPGRVGEAIRAVRPDVVINAAAYTAVDRAEAEPDLAMRVNGDAAGEAAAAAQDSGARFVQLSTDYVFDGALGRPYREDDPTGPLNVYGRTKLAGEVAVRAANPSHLIVRTSWVVSPFGSNFVKTMLRLAGERDEISVVDDQYGCPTSAPDLATGLLYLVERWDGDGRTLHLAGSGESSWADVAEAVMTASAANGGPTSTTRRITTADYPTPAKRPADTRLDCRAAAALGVSLRPWREGVADIVRELVR